MKKLSAVLIAAVIALSAAGCSSASNSAGSQDAPAPSAAPITMTPEEPAETSDPTPAASDADFIAAATYSWRGAAPSDAEFLAARDLACEQLRSGTPYDEVRVVEGDSEDATWNNDHLVKAAVTLECPEFDS